MTSAIRRRIGYAAALLVGAVLMQAAFAQAPPPGVFAEVQTAVVPRLSPALEPATMRSRVVQVDTQKIMAARRGREVLKLNLFDDAVVEVQIKRVRPTRTGYFISGTPKGMEWGEVRLVVNGPVVVGTVVTPEGKFTIRWGGSGRHVIRQIDPAAESFECEVGSTPPLARPQNAISSIDPPPSSILALPPSPQADELPTEDGSEVRVLVVYTPALLTRQGGLAGMRALIDLMIQSANQAFEDSGINPRLVLAHSALLDYVAETSSTDVHRLRRNDDGYMDEVHALRNEYAADLVHLLTESNTGPAGSAVRILGESLTYAEDKAFAVTATAHEETFTHEIGHNFGLKHDRYSAPNVDDAIYPYAFGYTNNKAFEPDASFASRWRTIMAYADRCGNAGFGCGRLFRFSNPDQTHLGDRLGVPADDPTTGPDGPADARLTINNSTRWVGSFRSEACTDFTVSPETNVAPLGGGELVLKVNAGPGCLWEAESRSGYLTVTSETPAAGSSFVNIRVDANQSGAERSGTLSVAGKTVTVRQLATSDGICGRTTVVMDAIAKAAGFSGAAECDQVSDAHLAEIGTLIMAQQGLSSLKAGDFEGLTALTFLNLELNSLASLPKGLFVGLSSLQYLGLNRNQLTELPAGTLAELSALKGLRLDNNELADLPASSFAGLSNLEELRLDLNRLTALPADLFVDLTSLQILSLTHNDLSELPDGLFSNLSDLEHLELYANELAELPAGLFAGLSKLKKLDLGDNPATEFPDGLFAGLSSLQELSLSGIHLAELPENTFFGLSNLQVLELNKGQFVTLPAGLFAGLAKLETLTLFNAQLTSLPPGSFSGLSNLQELNLYANQLSELPAGLFAGLASLQRLFLGRNQFTGLPPGLFSGLSALEELSLNHNQMSSLPDNIFTGLASLETLNLAGNRVDPLPLSLSLEKAGDSRFKAVASAGAPFSLVLEVSASEGGMIVDDATTIMIPAGAVESEPLGITRLEGTDQAVNVDYGALPDLPAKHSGYVLEKDEDLPRWILTSNDQADATLIGIAVSDGNLDPGFAATTSNYSVSVANLVTAITLTPTTSNGSATLAFFGANDQQLADADTDTDGHQANLLVGDNKIEVVVTAADGTTQQRYSLTVTREESNCQRTAQVVDAIVEAVPGIDECGNVTNAHLSEITELHLSGRGITSLLSGDFSGLIALRGLWLYENQLTRLPDDVFSGLSTLELLSLRSNQLENLQVDLFLDLSSLRSLYLSDNQLSVVPERIFSGLAQLENLWLDQNQLGSLPADLFSGLSRLRSLLLWDNQIDSLPAELFSGLSSLRSIWLEGNRLASLPSGVFSGLSSVRSLGLEGNQLTSLPSGVFSDIPEIEVLYLNGNRLTQLPDGVFSGLSSLRRLWLSYNQLTSLPDGVFSGLGALRDLGLTQLGGDLPLIVTLEEAGTGQFKAVAPSGAPYTIEVPVSISSSGTIEGGVSSLVILTGAVESEPLSIVRAAEHAIAATVDIGTFGDIPVSHSGYYLEKDGILPLEIPLPEVGAPPGQVTGVEVTVGVEKLEVSWTAVPDASGYKVQWKSGDEEYNEARQVVLAGGDTTPYTITGLTAGTEYTIRVLATKENSDDGLPSSEVTGTPSALPASQVTNIVVSASVEQLEVSWDSVSDANGYKVQWKSGAEDYGEERQAVLTGGETVSYTITGLAAGTEYTIRVIAARENAVDGTPSSEVAGIPKASPPSQVTGVEVAAGVEQLALIWTANADAGGYKVQWKSGEEDYDDSRQATITDGDDVDYTITGLTAGTEHTVRIIATKVNAEDSLPSDEVTGTPRAMPAGQVTGVRVSSGVEQLDVSWTAVSDASGYRVQWKSGDEAYDAAREVEVAGGETLGHTITGLTAGTEYTARVIAVMDNADDGPPSSEVSGAPKALPPAQVTGVELSVGVEQLDVSWSVVSDASGYKVQWKSGEEDYDEARQTVVTGGNTVNYTIAGLTVGTSYTIRVIATKAHADGGAPSTEVTGIPKAGPPVQVEGVEVTPGVEQLDVSWTAVSDAGGYKVQWKSGSEDYAELRQAVLIDGDTVSHTIESLTAGTEYTVRVIATKEFADDGLPSEQVTAIPKATPPAQVTGVEVEPGAEQLEVLWTPVTDAGGYKVQWKSGTEAYGDARQAVIGSGDTTTHTITGLTADTEYTIRVIATKDNADDGTPSDEVTATPISADPDVNGDGVLDGNDALILYHSYASAAQLGDGETGGTAASRQSLLAGYSGQTSPSDDDLKAMIRKANAWKEAGVNAGGDINEDGVIDESDAFVMYYAYATENLVGDGETGGTARFRQLLLAAFANKDNPTDEDLKAMLRRANELREDFG